MGIHALAHAEDIDAVYIATPNTVHAAQAVAMLESGKHVLVEKPAAVSAKELGHMTAAAKRNGKILMEAMMPLYTPRVCGRKASDTQYSSGSLRDALFTVSIRRAMTR